MIVGTDREREKKRERERERERERVFHPKSTTHNKQGG
jgi:hypothetical protein